MNGLTAELNNMNSDLEATKLAEAQKRITALVDRTYQASVESKEAEAKLKELKSELCLLMSTSEVDKIIGTNCTASCTLKTSVTVPKEDADKAKLFKYITDEYGSEVLDAMLTINPRRFSSWHDKEVQKHVDAGNIDFKLDMLAPYEYHSVGFRKKAKK